MVLEPWNILFRPNEKVSSLDLGPNIYTNTYFSKIPNGDNMPMKDTLCRLSVWVQGVVIVARCIKYFLKA
jgi:hypothetical protein